VTRYRAILFDWRRTLVHDPDLTWWVTQSLASVDRAPDAATIASIEERLIAAFERPEYLELERSLDTSADVHRQGMLTIFGWAGLDEALANALYELDFDPASHPLYPDVPDALSGIRAMGIKTALVSNIHFDVRPELAEQGIFALLDAVVLSFEHGIQKPDPRMFELALDALAVTPSEAVMVGDTPSSDGGAAAIGVTTIILPTLRNFGPRDFGPVLSLLRA
jgi:HAD superfamily hydrolase (TIGR01509 family)